MEKWHGRFQNSAAISEHNHMHMTSISKNFVYGLFIVLVLESRLTLDANAPGIRGKIVRNR
jgi:hypothetical protein